MSAVGFVTGLAVESRTLGRGLKAYDPGLAPPIACAGARSDRARREADRLIAEGAEVLVSFGVAGGLDPRLRAGDLLLPNRVEPEEGPSFATDQTLVEGLREAAGKIGLTAGRGTLFGSDRVIAEVAEKAALHRKSGAEAVDMESLAVAQAAQAAGVPFLVIRAVIDSAGHALPSSVIGSTDEGGRSRGGLVAARLCVRPWQIPDISRLRARLILALETLEGFATAAAPILFGRL